MNKKNFIWNTVGSLINSASTMLLLMIVGRGLGAAVAGLFSISLAISQLFVTVGNFEVRPYQSTDLNEDFSFSEYLTFRVISCTVMILCGLSYTLLNGYRGNELAVVLAMCFFKGFEAFTDVFHGLFQQKDCLHIAGKSMFFRGIITTVIFAGGIFFIKDLFITIMMMNIFSLIWTFFYEWKNVKNLAMAKWECHSKRMKRIFLECLPLFMSAFIAMYLTNSPKYAIDKFMTPQIQGIFGYIFMPTAVINLFSIFVLRPMTTSLTVSWQGERKKEFLKNVFLITGWIFILTVVTLAGGCLLGIPILSWFYSTDLSHFKTELLIVLLGGGFSALTTALYYILTVMRRQRIVLYGYIFVFIGTLFIVPQMTETFGLIGASLGYLLSMLLLSISLIAAIISSIKYIHRQKDSH